MALIRNGSHQLTGLSRFHGAVGAYGLRSALDNSGQRKNFNSGEHAVSGVTNKAAIPAGARHPIAWRMGTKAGSLASHSEAQGAATATLAMASGINIAGLSEGLSDALATLQLVVSMQGTAAGIATVTGNILAALGMAGTAAGTSTGSGTVGALAWCAGTAAGVGTGSLTSYATGRLVGTTEESGLTNAGIANSVWSYIIGASEAQDLLAAAGAAGDPLLGVVEGTLTLRDVQRIVLSVLAGQVTGAGTGTETFKGQSGEDRVVSTVDTNGNRSSVVLDAA